MGWSSVRGRLQPCLPWGEVIFRGDLWGHYGGGGVDSPPHSMNMSQKKTYSGIFQAVQNIKIGVLDGRFCRSNKIIDYTELQRILRDTPI